MNDRFSFNGKAKPSQKSTSTEFEVRSKALRSKIGERLDHLTGLWHDIEKKLIALQQPRHVCHIYREMPRDQNNGVDADCYCIGIAKYAGKWRLCLGEFNEWRDPEARISWHPITDCTMEERIAAAPFVGELEKKIVDTGEKVLPKLDEAIRHLEDRLGGI
jgi:hypothetical protein